MTTVTTRIGTGTRCPCCGAEWHWDEAQRGYSCECPMGQYCKHCSKCPTHCTGEPEAELRDALQDAYNELLARHIPPNYPNDETRLLDRVRAVLNGERKSGGGEEKIDE